MAASVTANESLIAQAQQSNFRTWGEAEITPIPKRRRIFTWGLPIGPQPQRQAEKRVEMGGPGDYISG